MLWFGGHKGPTSVSRPVGTRYLWPRSTSVWISETFPTEWIHTAEAGSRRVAILGVCGIPKPYVRDLAERGVPNNVTWLWPGSYIAVESSDTGVKVWTDLGSARPIYVREYAGAYVWANSARLLASLDSTGLDLNHLVGRVLPPEIGAPDVLSTYFSGVERVPAGHRLDLPTKGKRRTLPTWRRRSVPNAHHARNLRSALEEAVHVRLKMAARVTADLSGGFDSTALALLAVQHRSADELFPVITGHPEGVTIGGDLDYANEVAEHPGFRRYLLPRGSGQAPYQGFTDIPAGDEPAPSTMTFALLRHQLTWLRRFGSDLHMTGDGGDSLLSTPLVFINDLIHRKRIRRAAQEAARWAQLRDTSLIAVLCRVRSQHSTIEALPKWFTAQACQRRRIRPVHPFPGVFTGSEAQDHIFHAISEIGRSAHADAQVAEALGVALHNPYTDGNVIDTYLAIPPLELPSPTRYKPVLAQAMSDLFPARLLRRTTKGDSTSDHYRGVREALPNLRTLMDGRLRELGLIDLSAMHHALTQVAVGTGPALYQIKNTLAAETWVRSLESAPEIRWEPPCPTT